MNRKKSLKKDNCLPVFNSKAISDGIKKGANLFISFSSKPRAQPCVLQVRLQDSQALGLRGRGRGRLSHHIQDVSWFTGVLSEKDTACLRPQTKAWQGLHRDVAYLSLLLFLCVSPRASLLRRPAKDRAARGRSASVLGLGPAGRESAQEPRRAYLWVSCVDKQAGM